MKTFGRMKTITKDVIEEYGDDMIRELQSYLMKTSQYGGPVRHLNDSRCWMFTGHINAYGYGILFFSKKSISEEFKFQCVAHRASYMVFNRLLDRGEKCLHKCDNRPCFNPDHLYVGTQKDNMKDATLRRSYAHPLVKAWKLTTEKVRMIKILLAAGIKQQKIANQFNVSHVAIYKISTEETWRHVKI